MTDTPHPFRAVAMLALQQDLPGLKLVEEDNGAYVRLTYDADDLFFKRKTDPRDSRDRESFGEHKRINLTEAELEQGPAATLRIIREHLKHFGHGAGQDPA